MRRKLKEQRMLPLAQTTPKLEVVQMKPSETASEGRSGQLIAKNDAYIYMLLSDPDYKIAESGQLFTRISRQGHTTNFWREKRLVIDNGYLSVSYRRKKIAYHRLMYAAFIGPLSPDLVINHIDGNPLNNSLTNLELVTQSENNVHRFKKTPPVIGNKKINQEMADEIRRQVAEENRRACDMAKKYDLCRSTISYILNNKTWNR